MGCRSIEEARAAIMGQTRSEWGMAGFMVQGMLLVFRLHEIGLSVAESRAGRQRTRPEADGGREPWDVQRAAQAFQEAMDRRQSPFRAP